MTRAHPRVLVALLVVVAAGTTGSYLALRGSSNYQRTVALANVHHYSSADVRTVFARHGIHLAYGSNSTPGAWLSATPLPVPVTGLYAVVATGNGQVSWGQKPNDEFEETVGNLLIHYGGSNARLLAEIRAATADLRSATGSRNIP